MRHGWVGVMRLHRAVYLLSLNTQSDNTIYTVFIFYPSEANTFIPYRPRD